jgi:hypothetical protein
MGWSSLLCMGEDSNGCGCVGKRSSRHPRCFEQRHERKEASLRANMDETTPPVLITEQGENRNQLEDQWNLFGFPYDFARRET